MRMRKIRRTPADGDDATSSFKCTTLVHHEYETVYKSRLKLPIRIKDAQEISC